MIEFISEIKTQLKRDFYCKFMNKNGIKTYETWFIELKI